MKEIPLSIKIIQRAQLYCAEDEFTFPFTDYCGGDALKESCLYEASRSILYPFYIPKVRL